jgi:hypothetical protein
MRKVMNVISPGLKSITEITDAGMLAAIGGIFEHADEKTDKIVEDTIRHAKIMWNGRWEPVMPNLPEHVPHGGVVVELFIQIVMLHIADFMQVPTVKRELAKMMAAKGQAEAETQESTKPL